MARKCFIGGNFKAAGSLATVKAQVATLNGCGEFPANAEVVVAPSALHIGTVKDGLTRPDVGVAIQDIHTVKGMGAYTGSHTADLVVDFGLHWTIIGHSERRSIWGETDSQVATKVKVALEAGLSVILCVGETLAEREAGATLEVVHRQIKAVADLLASGGAPGGDVAGAWARIVTAYEPVWAIGTGRVATAEQAQEVHAALRAWLAANVSADVAAAQRIIYGGSVTGANCGGLIGQADIDGFLVGGASLKPEFVDIIRSAATKA